MLSEVDVKKLFYVLALCMASNLLLMAERKLTNHVKTEYPAIALQTGVSGVVSIKLTVLASGSVKAADVLYGHPVLGEYCKKIVSAWKFESGKEESLDATFIFRLVDSSEKEDDIFDQASLTTSLARHRQK